MSQVYVVDFAGVFLVDTENASRPVRLQTVVAVANSDGSITMRVPARDVVVANQIDPMQTYDMSDLPRLKIAVQYGGLTIATVMPVRPLVAAALNAWLTANGITPGTAQ